MSSTWPRFVLYPLRRKLYRQVGFAWRNCSDPDLAEIQSVLRSMPGVLDALPGPGPTGGGTFMVELVVDSSARQRSIAAAGELGVKWMLEHVGDLPCTILVWDETQVKQAAVGRHLPGEETVDWDFAQSGH